MSGRDPKSRQEVAHPLEILCRAVSAYSWYYEPLSRAATHGHAFQRRFEELEAALNLHKKTKLIMFQEESASLSSVENDKKVIVDYNGQSRYLKVTRHRTHGSSQKAFIPLSLFGCLNCEDHRHLLQDCPHPLNLANAAAQKLEYFKTKRIASSILLVLADICFQISRGSTHTETDNDNLDFF